jgi:hypothetical protein
VALEGVPPSVQRGTPFTVTVVEYVSPDGSVGSGQRTPVQGATVTGGGASAVTDANGQATLAMPATGSFSLKAFKSSRARSAAEAVCVHDGDDGNCGTVAAGPGGPPGTGDVRMPVARILGIRNGQRFRPRRAPRLLRGGGDPGAAGAHASRLRLRRAAGGRCWFYSARLERFRRGRCAATHFFYTVSDTLPWSYLLPERLGPGRYVLDATVVDRWGRTARARVAFTVLAEARR